MNLLQRRLASLRRRLRLQICWRGFCSLVGLVIGAAVLIGLADWFLDLPSLIRALALVAILGSAGWAAYRILILPLAKRCDDLSLALQIEEHYPDLNDSLASTVQFLQEGVRPAPGSSSSLREAAIQRTLALLDNHDFNKILPRRGLRWLAVGALVACAAGAHFLYHHKQFAEIALWRLADPFGRHTWTSIQLDDPPHRVAQGQPFVLRGQIAGVVPVSARIEIDGNLKSEKIVALKTDAKTPHAGTLVAGLDMTQQKGKFRFRIHANDAVYPPQAGGWHEVEVLPPPKFAMLNGMLSPQIEFRFPAYTDLHSPATLTPGTKHISEILGTHVTYRAAFDRPLENAWIEFRPENPAVRAAALLAHLGQARVLNTLGALGTSHAVWGRAYARFDETKKIVAIPFVPWVSGTYILHVGDENGLVKEFEADLRMLPDPVPTVQLQKPATSRSVVPDAEIAFKMFVNDDTFAVRNVFIEYRKKDADNRWLDEGPQRVYLYDHETMGKALPRLLAGLASRSAPGPELRLRPKNLEIITKWALKNQFKEGETIVLQVGAEDFCDLFPDRPAGHGHEIELRIVTKEEIARVLDDGLGKAQQEIVRLKQMQEEALNLIKDIQKKRQENKSTQREIDQLIEAEQLQKQIQERLGNRPEEGLRDELAKMQQTIKDNKLPPSKVQDQIKTLKNELDRLAQEDLQQIEPNLAEARKEMIGTAKPTPKNKGPLDKAQKLQEQAKKTLDELAKFLDPWASMHQIQGETRALLDKQKELRKDVEKAFDEKNEDQKGALGQKAEMQMDLAKKAESLLDTINKAKDKGKKTKAEDDTQKPEKIAKKENNVEDRSQKLAKAAKIGEPLATKMDEVAKEIKKDPTRPNIVREKQSEIVKTLEKMLAALEDRKDDDLDRLQKKQKNAAEVKENVDKLAQDQDTLRKKTKEANKIENPEERAQALKKLAEKQEKLKEEAEKNARELARLQEERAARALDRAAQEMDRAAQKLEEGENPDENQQEALDRVEDAQAKLEQFEEELSREQVAQIADRIKGLKERQDAALERSKELHKKVTAKMKWSTGLLETLSGDITSQKGLAEETRSLKEKIKEAKIFEHVFEKAAKAMDEAAAEMTARKENGKDRQLLDLEKEELADESKKAQDIEKLQSLASKRLQRLLDSLKNDPADVAQNDDDPDHKPGEPGDEHGGQKMRPGDGVPPLAQLKVLRAEQQEVNEQTKEFAKNNPNQNNLNPAQQRELTSLEAEQKRLHELFEQMTAATEKKGGEQ